MRRETPSVDLVVRRDGIGKAASIDTVMMKYRRHSSDEREDEGGWPAGGSFLLCPEGLLPQASVM